jgi:hypothetical protein
MGQFSMEIYAPTGSLLSGNLQPWHLREERSISVLAVIDTVAVMPFEQR